MSSKAPTRREILERFRAKADEALRESKARTHKKRNHIEEIFEKVNHPEYRLPACGSLTILNSARHSSVSQRIALKNLLLAVEDKSAILNSQKLVEAVCRLASWSAFWIRQPEDWQPKSHNIQKQFSSLARFLLCDYYVPLFMDVAWFSHYSQWQEWFIWIGIGNNIRKADNLPFPLTKMMAHRFLESPDNLTVEEGFVWGLCKSLQANDALSKTLISSQLTRYISKYKFDFWTSVITFFVNNSDMLSMSQVGPIIDYINNQKYVEIGRVNQNGTLVHLGPPQPGFSMHHRTMDVLITQTEIWHKQLSKAKDIKNLFWPSCGILGFDREEGEEKKRRFVIEEILGSKELRVEGSAMHHCVYSYASRCSDGNYAVYSLKADFGAGLQRRATIGVLPNQRQIVEARIKMNDPLTELDKRVIKAWAMKSKLTFGHGVLK